MMLPMLSCCRTPFTLQFPLIPSPFPPSVPLAPCSWADVLDTTGQPVSSVICCWFKQPFPCCSCCCCSFSARALWYCSAVWYCCCCCCSPTYCCCCTVKAVLV